MPEHSFRLGATSYVIPADLVANACYLAGRVQDMQLVLFDVPNGPSNLPDANTVATLARIGQSSGLSYTVHLIQDLDPQPDGTNTPDSWHKAHSVIASTRLLQPVAYVAHLNARALRAAHYAQQPAWEQAAALGLQQIAAWCAGPAHLAIENLEGYPPALVQNPVDQAAAGRCVDIGHLWLDDHDPLPHLEAATEHLRVIHLHGVHCFGAHRQDHQPLDCVPAHRLDAITSWLLQRRFTGVVTLEVFEEEPFTRSLAAFHASLARVGTTTESQNTACTS
jgi:sugar phosphate isomerase/epimerase